MTIVATGAPPTDAADSVCWRAVLSDVGTSALILLDGSEEELRNWRSIAGRAVRVESLPNLNELTATDDCCVVPVRRGGTPVPSAYAWRREPSRCARTHGRCTSTRSGPMRPAGRACEDGPAGVKRGIERAMGEQDWQDAGAGWQGKDGQLRLPEWSRHRRIVIWRWIERSLALTERGGEGQLRLGFAEIDGRG